MNIGIMEVAKTGREAMTMKDNQMQKPEDVIEPRSEYGNLPPELKAMQTMMDAVFNAVTNAAPGGGSQPVDSEHEANAGARASVVASFPAVPAAAPVPRRMDIEEAIMRAPGFDYLLASEIFAALQRRLELRYENLNPQVEEAMQRLAKSFDHVTG